MVKPAGGDTPPPATDLMSLMSDLKAHLLQHGLRDQARRHAPVLAAPAPEHVAGVLMPARSLDDRPDDVHDLRRNIGRKTRCALWVIHHCARHCFVLLLFPCPGMTQLPPATSHHNPVQIRPGPMYHTRE